MIFDSHAHYDDEAFDDDRDNLLSSMHKDKVELLINVGASMQSTRNSVELAHRYSFIYASVGVHPNETGELDDNNFKELCKLAKDEKVVAIGEIGLDYHFMEPESDIQKYWFEKQLELAATENLPVIIHSRDAAADTMDIMKKHYDSLHGGVIHCYSYSVEMAEEYVKMGYYIGIGGVVTFKNAKKLKEVAERIPLNKIVLETDCPYLAPEPNRGTRNDSRNLIYVAEVIADIRGIELSDVYEATFKNACDLYQIQKG